MTVSPLRAERVSPAWPNRLREIRSVLVDGFSSGGRRRRRVKPALQSFIECPFASIGQQAPRGSFVSVVLRSLHPLDDIVPASVHLAASAAAQMFLRQ